MAGGEVDRSKESQVKLVCFISELLNNYTVRRKEVTAWGEESWGSSNCMKCMKVEEVGYGSVR